MNNFPILNKILQRKQKNTIVDILSYENIKREVPANYISTNNLNTKGDVLRVSRKLEKCCGEVIYSDSVYLSKSTGEIKEVSKISDIHSCNNHLLCPVCASQKGRRVLDSIKPFYVVLMEMGYNAYLITPTVVNCPVEDVEYHYRKIRQSWTKFVKMGQKRSNGKRSSGELSKMVGYVMGVEVSAGVGGTAHVHAHILVIVDGKLDYTIYNTDKKKVLIDKYGFGNIPDSELRAIAVKTINYKGEAVPMSKISSEWYGCTGDSFNIDVRPLSGGVAGLSEVVKYSIKQWEFGSVASLLSLYDSMQAKKTVTRGGVFGSRGRQYFFELLVRHDKVDRFLELEKGDIVIDLQEFVLHKIGYISAKIGSNIDIYDSSSFSEYYRLFIKNRSEMFSKLSLLTAFYRKRVKMLKQELSSIGIDSYIRLKEVLYNGYVSFIKVVRTMFSCVEMDKPLKFEIDPVQLDLFRDVFYEVIEYKKSLFKRENIIFVTSA